MPILDLEYEKEVEALEKSGKPFSNEEAMYDSLSQQTQQLDTICFIAEYALKYFTLISNKKYLPIEVISDVAESKIIAHPFRDIKIAQYLGLAGMT